jgi:hypothetical protein
LLPRSFFGLLSTAVAAVSIVSLIVKAFDVGPSAALIELLKFYDLLAETLFGPIAEFFRLRTH